MTATTTITDTRPFAWFRTLGHQGKRAFVGAFGGYGLDSFDYQTLPLGLAAITAYFGISNGQAGLLGTTTLVVSAVGGVGAGMLADRIGRVRALQLTIAMYTIFTVLCGFAPNFETLLVLRGLQGLGFGGEWAVGAALVAEYAQARYRGRTVAFVQSAWAVGWGLSVVVYTVVFTFASPDMAWRITVSEARSSRSSKATCCARRSSPRCSPPASRAGTTPSRPGFLRTLRKLVS